MIDWNALKLSIEQIINTNRPLKPFYVADLSLGRLIADNMENFTLKIHIFMLSVSWAYDPCKINFYDIFNIHLWFTK